MTTFYETSYANVHRAVHVLGERATAGLEGAREKFGARISEEELLLRLTMPAEQVEAMLRSPPATQRPPALARPGRDPLVSLLAELAKRSSISYMRLQKGDDLVVWRRAS